MMLGEPGPVPAGLVWELYTHRVKGLRETVRRIRDENATFVEAVGNELTAPGLLPPEREV